MIVVYPMLTSESVNPTLLPGIIKAVEKYVIVYMTEDYVENVNSALKKGVKIAVTGVKVAADVALAGVGIAAAYKAAKAAGAIGRVKVKGKKIVFEAESSKSNKDREPSTKDKIDRAADSVEKALDSKVKRVDMPKHDAVSLEPTWVQVETEHGVKVIGIKVVPFKVTSTNGMIGLLMNDQALKGLSYFTNKASRTIMRVLIRAAKGLRIPGMRGRAVSGNAKEDIVWASSQYGKNMLVAFSQLDLEKDDIFSSPKAVKKLYKLGWASMIITDDVNKQVTFCMKQFGGICSTIGYPFIFSSLGKEIGQVYKDIEDAQRSAGPLRVPIDVNYFQMLEH